MRQEEQQVTQDHPEAVRSAPVPVPQPGEHSDPARRDADRADVPEDALDDRGSFDDPAVADDRRDAEVDETRAYEAGELRDAADPTDDDGRRPFHEPAPLPTAFGAATVGDAVAASALASGRPQDERDARDEDTAVPGDGAPGRTDPLDDERADPTAGDRLHDRDRWDAEHTGATGDGDAAVRDDAVTDGAVGYGSAEPGLVDPDAEPVPAADDADPRHDRVDPDTATAAAAGAAGTTLGGADRPAPGAVPADAATLFAPEAAQGFRDRWRDVQLRFVDDPRAAVGEAESLVEEAIEALSTALREQRTRLGAWQESGSTDTEQLRVAVRGYRDFLDRVLGR
ncbi:MULTISPECIES: hypothetical protein [unclassified Micromonospora]|uniref:hypothetical protein n=1 Tax=unclassified Micromonospora TaxID=2617518 RepID=UPI001C246343|nr:MULTISPECIES: hypothetical protein [unclassified Micromonospora]MBU8856727.1 hypothetical protein [Micromonospora sp. WMMB482]MDM4782342.1 hypothetical protein [Micromonospora sp. b486]